MIELVPPELRAKWAAEWTSEPITVEHLGRMGRLLAVEAELEQWRAIGAALDDTDPCEFDAWNGCIVHTWPTQDGPCPFGRIRELLAAEDADV
jgi:hypothetical protein